jgi:hypothetical protein
MHGVIDIRTRTAQYVTAHNHGDRCSCDYGALLGLALVLLTFAGWCQHLYTCFNEGLWSFLITGAIVTPIGIIHGWSIWLWW